MGREGGLVQDLQIQIGEAGQRILDSEGLRRSGRLRELLAYLLKRAAAAPDIPIREQDIGHEVYGRNPDYDTSHDTIVRVQIAQLRKKLERYYETEGAHDDLILTIPKGRYLPHWQPRTIETVALPPVPPAPKPSRAIAIACAALLLVIAVLLFEWPRPAVWQNQTLSQSPAVAHLWNQVLVPERTTQVVLSDPGLVMLARVSGQPVRFSELSDRGFWDRLQSLKNSPDYQSFVQAVTSSQLATLSDVEIVRRITALGISDPAMLNIVTARDFRIRDLNSSNSILIGYGTSNPWVEVFQQTTNFVMHVSGPKRWIDNLHPENSEPAQYLLADNQKGDAAQGFATVALFPNPTRSGRVMILAGADVPGTEAAIRFLMTESLWEPFYRKIAVNGRIPSFEVVLAYRRISNSSGDINPVAWRIY